MREEPLSAEEQAKWQELLGEAHRGCGGCFACRLSQHSMSKALEHGPEWLEVEENLAGLAEEVLGESLQDDYTATVTSTARVIADLLCNGGPRAMELNDHLEAAIKALAISQRAAAALLGDVRRAEEQRDALLAFARAYSVAERDAALARMTELGVEL